MVIPLKPQCDSSHGRSLWAFSPRLGKRSAQRSPGLSTPVVVPNPLLLSPQVSHLGGRESRVRCPIPWPLERRREFIVAEIAAAWESSVLANNNRCEPWSTLLAFGSVYLSDRLREFAASRQAMFLHQLPVGHDGAPTRRPQKICPDSPQMRRQRTFTASTPSQGLKSRTA